MGHTHSERSNFLTPFSCLQCLTQVGQTKTQGQDMRKEIKDVQIENLKQRPVSLCRS